jgi:hypothetical protein
MKSSFVLLLVLSVLTVHSQIHITAPLKLSQCRLNFTFTPQLYLNGINVESDGIKPEGITTRNTGGYTAGVEFERKSKTGFLLNFGMQYAIKHHSLSMGYDSLGFFDRGVAQILDKLGPQIEHYSVNSSYLKFRFMVGYAIPYKVLRGCHLEVKAGFSIGRSLTGFYGEYYRGVQFERNDTIYKAEIAYGNFGFGGSGKSMSWSKTAECSIALKKELNTKYLKDISIGLEFTRAIFFAKQSTQDDGYFDARTLYVGNPIISTDKYISKDFSIGLRLCAGLWCK